MPVLAAPRGALGVLPASAAWSGRGSSTAAAGLPATSCPGSVSPPAVLRTASSGRGLAGAAAAAAGTAGLGVRSLFARPLPGPAGLAAASLATAAVVAAAAARSSLRRRRPRGQLMLRAASSVAGEALLEKAAPQAAGGSATQSGGYNSAVGGRTRISQILDAADGGRSFIGSTVTVCGWVRTVRAQKEFTFVKVNDGSTFREMQAVIEPGATGFDAISAQRAGASVRIEGRVVESEGAGQEVELSCASVEHSVKVLGGVDSATYPLAKKKHSIEYLRTIAHLRPRTNLIGAVTRVRSALAGATHRFFQDRGFLYIHTPIITTADCEGAGEMFRVMRTDDNEKATEPVAAWEAPKASAEDLAALEASKDQVRILKEAGTIGPDFEAAIAEMKRLKDVCGEKDLSSKERKQMEQAAKAAKEAAERAMKEKEFFGQPAYLTVSGQLAVENFCCSLGDVYTFGPTFRAETSNTTRHLAEFWMIEPEMAFADIFDDMDCAEAYIRHCASTILETCGPDLQFFTDKVDKDLVERLKLIANEPFKRMSYTEAVEVLQKAISDGDVKFEFEVAWGKELQTEHEKYLTDRLYHRPTIVYNYPKDCKAFYMRLNDDGKTVAAMDILCPGIGELVGGSQREERLEMLDRRIAEMGMNTEDLWWYRDLRQYGSVPHAGFGVGFERLVMLCTGVQNIRDVIPFPRYAGHAQF
mmetsp:Transcript_10142/g.35494  ORF Transcript_10142/g.35494 Transcript_10142/m.35494 type:complete len:700 (-) Transcript_10142:68-2167(-)